MSALPIPTMLLLVTKKITIKLQAPFLITVNITKISGTQNLFPHYPNEILMKLLWEFYTGLAKSFVQVFL